MIAKAFTRETRSRFKYNDASDEQLLIWYRDLGDVRAFETLVHRFDAPIHSFLLRYLRNASLAEDVYQASIVRIHEKCGLFAEGHKVRPWVYKIATNQAIDAFRRESRHRAASLDELRWVDDTNLGALIDLLQSSTPTPLEQATEHERAEWAHRAVDALPDHQRVVMLLVFFQGFKYSEAAEILQIPEGTIKSRVHKALLALRQAWRHDHCMELR